MCVQEKFHTTFTEIILWMIPANCYLTYFKVIAWTSDTAAAVFKWLHTDDSCLYLVFISGIHVHKITLIDYKINHLTGDDWVKVSISF